MEPDNNNEDPQESINSLTETLPSFGADEHNEINPSQEIFGAHDSSSRANDVTKNSDQELDEEGDMDSYRMSKRQRRMEYRMIMEQKRQRIINEKVDILQGMMHLNTQADLATKIKKITEQIKLLVHHRDVLAMQYTANHARQCYGGQAPCYGAQAQWYGAQAPCYGAQAQCYGAQAQCYGAQAQCYGAQAQWYGAQAPCYGTQTPCMSPWGCYAHGTPIIPQQNMPYIPQYNQVHNTAQPEQTKP